MFNHADVRRLRRQTPGGTCSGKRPMRPLFSFAALLVAVPVGAVPVGYAEAQSAVPPDQNGSPPSLLAPRMSDAPPPPTPIMPPGNGQPPVPPGLVAAPPSVPTPPAASDLGTVTAVPLPPPGLEPVRPPVPAPAPGTSAATGSPAAGAPISLAPPRPPPRAAEPGTSSPAIKTGAKAEPGTSSPLAKDITAGAKTALVPLESNKLPEPPLSPEASPTDFLRAARGALAAGRNGEARSALEMAQTRLLDRVVDAGTEQHPSDNAAVKQISQAIDALLANDRMACLRYIEFASRTLGAPLD